MKCNEFSPPVLKPQMEFEILFRSVEDVKNEPWDKTFLILKPLDCKRQQYVSKFIRILEPL